MPEECTWPVHEHMVRYFNHYLKGKDNGADGDATVRYYVMGAVGEVDALGNVCRTAADFPPKSQPADMFLHTGWMSQIFNTGHRI